MGARGPHAHPRLPWDPIRPFLRQPARPGDHDSYGIMHLARLLDIGPGNLHRWKRDGFTLAAAERCARAFGVHPGEVWGNDYWRLTGALDRQNRPTWRPEQVEA